MKKVINKIKKSFAALTMAFAVVLGVASPALAEGTTPTITIDTANAEAIGTAITGYMTDIMPTVLSIIGGALALWFLFYFLGLGKRGANQAKSSR